MDCLVIQTFLQFRMFVGHYNYNSLLVLLAGVMITSTVFEQHAAVLLRIVAVMIVCSSPNTNSPGMTKFSRLFEE